MRFLPRSRRGTWLLAGAVWCAASAAWWALVPVGPRATFENEPTQFHFRFRADRSTVLCLDAQSLDSDQIWFGSRTIPHADRGCTIRDLQTGETIRQWRSMDEAYAISWCGDWAVKRTTWKDPSPILRNLRTGESQPLPWPSLGDKCAADVTADGELLVLATRRDSITTTYWWDLRHRQPISEFVGREPIALAPDGRWLTRGDNGVDLLVLDRASAQSLATIHSAREFEHAEFSPDGRYVLLIAVDACQVFDAATGRLCAALPNSVAVISTGTDRLMAINLTSWELEAWDLVSGRRLSSQPVVGDRQGDSLLSVWRAPAIDSLVLNWISSPPMNDFFYRIPFFSRLFSGPISEVQTIRAADGARSERRRVPLALGSHIAPDVQSMLVTTSGSDVLIYDIPPRRSMTWFAAGAAALGLPIALVAWWRGRKLIA